MADDHAVAEAARNYVGKRLAMSEEKQETLTMIIELDDAWCDLLNAYDAEHHEGNPNASV